MLSPYTVTIYTKQDNPYNVIPDAPIEIRERLANGTSGNLSTIYEDQEGLIPITQTGAKADSNGQFTFYAEAAQYNAIYESQTVPVDVGLTVDTLPSAMISNLSLPYVFDTVANMTASAIIFPVGKRIYVNDRKAYFTFALGGSADGYSVLDAGSGNTTTLVKEGKMYVEMFGVSQSNTIAENTNAYNAAFAFMNGATVYQKNKRYTYSGSYAGIVSLCGEQRPTVNAGRTALENGSILEGTTNFSNPYVVMCNIGFDHGVAAFPSTGADAFKASASPYDSGRLCLLHGVVGLGRNDTDAFHGILVEGYEHAHVKECVGARNQFAYAIKSRNVDFAGNRAIGGRNGCIIKSDSGAGGGAGSAPKINVDNFIHEGSAISEHGMRVLSDNAGIELLNINNINITGSDRCLTLEAVTNLSDVNISNVNGKDIRLFGIVTSGVTRNVNITNVNLVDCGDYVAQFLNATNLTIDNFYASVKGASTHIDTSMRVESGVSSFTGSNINIVVDRNDGFKGSIFFANASSQNFINNVKAYVRGNIPRPNYFDEVVDDGLVNPVFDADKGFSVGKLSSASPVNITNISTTIPVTGVEFPLGYRLILVSNGQTLTYIDSANMRTKVGGNRTRLVNQVIEWVWLGSSWHQVDDTPA